MQVLKILKNIGFFLAYSTICEEIKIKTEKGHKKIDPETSFKKRLSLLLD